MPALEIEERVARLEGRVDEHSKFFESLSVKLTNLEAKGDRNKEDLEKKIDSVKAEIEKKIDELKDRIRDLEVKMSSFKAEIIKWMFLFWAGQLVVVAGLIKWLR